MSSESHAWVGYEPGLRFNAPFWQQPLWRWELSAGSLRAQFGAQPAGGSTDAVTDRGLIANISFTGGDVCLGQTAYYVCKSAFDWMALRMAADPGVGPGSGQCLSVGKLAVRYGFTAIEGRQPPASKWIGESRWQSE